SPAIGGGLGATASGLIIAIPAFGAFYFLRNRARASIHHIQDITTRLFATRPYESLAGVHLGDEELYAAIPNWLVQPRGSGQTGKLITPAEERKKDRDMAAGAGGAESGEPEFQVAPMIDVLLTILVFFMTITSAQVLKVDKTINLPVAKDAQKKDNSRAETVVNVRWKDKKAGFVFDDRVFTQAAEMVEPLK